MIGLCLEFWHSLDDSGALNPFSQGTLHSSFARLPDDTSSRAVRDPALVPA